MNRQADERGSFTDSLGATETTTVPVRTDDGRIFRAELYRSVNAADDPELRQRLLDGSLNEVDGPDGRTYRPAVGVRYHDPANRVFALVVPEPLRHRSFELRRELLEDLAAADDEIPPYVSNFAVVTDPDKLEELAESTETPSPPVDETGDFQPASGAEDPEGRREALDERESQLEDVRDRVDREREQLEAEREELEELRRELEREREEIAAEREELDQQRQSLEAERLNLEQKNRQADHDDEGSTSHSTQVVTDDQFISEAPRDPDESTADIDEPAPPDLAFDLRAAPVELDAVPSAFDEERAGDADGYLEVSGGRVRASARLPDARLERFADQKPQVYVQYHEVDGVPVAAVTLAVLEEGDLVDSFGWPLDPDDDVHSSALHRLTEDFDLDFALYDASGDLEIAYEFRGPFEENLQWIRERLEEERRERELPDDFSPVVETFESDDFERVGSMQHNFEREAFRQLDSASRVKLAAGVVGYWSSDEQIAYLIGNRTYPLASFRELQDQVIEAAIRYGIFLPEPLRDCAADLGIVADDVDLVESQLANFAEVAVQIRDNDLDPIDEWENWDELIELAKSVGVTPDPDVLELAESSLQRARDYQEAPADQSAEEGGVESNDEAGRSSGPEPSVAGADDGVVGRRSEATGVTYYVPDEAVIDTFDDLADMSREDLEKLLDDPNGRLEAAQMLVEQFDADVVPVVMETADQMSAPEVDALGRFLETRADGLEPQLVRAVETGGPSATFAAARALSEIRSTTALPKLLAAYRDPDRQLNREAVGRSLARYGEKLLPELTSSIEEDGVDEAVVQLLLYLEEAHDGILEELEDHRNDEVREAAERAREQRL